MKFIAKEKLGLEKGKEVQKGQEFEVADSNVKLIAQLQAYGVVEQVGAAHGKEKASKEKV